MFGVTAEKLRGVQRQRAHSDARSAYVHALYTHNIMSGIAIGKHLRCTDRNIYYHLKKYEDLKFNKYIAPVLERFEAEVEKKLRHE